MNKIRWFTLALPLAVFISILLTSFASAGPQAKTYTVNSSASDADANPGNGICLTAGGKCTLYAAIEEANLDGDTSTIIFNQKFQSTENIWGCSLPAITADYTTIDASSQWDTTYDRPGVEIRGVSCPMLTIQANNTAVLGLLFYGYNNVGVRIYGSLNTIGGYHTGQRNVFISGVVGVDIEGGTSNAVSNNYFGTITGEYAIPSAPDGVGIQVQAGDYTTVADNLIVGQDDYGIGVISSNNYVRDNIIGMSLSQTTALPNTIGIQIGWGSANTIGTGNVIAGNTSHGVYLAHTSNNIIKGNHIGYGSIGNGGDGINLHVSDNNEITQFNDITNNTGNGIYADASSGMAIKGNTIRDNQQVGIYLEQCSDGQVGVASPDEGNTIGGNQSHGIHLDYSSNITVTNNFIGLHQGAFDWGNQGHGVLIDNGSTGNYIGGGGPGEANWIGWNHLDGIELDGSSTYNNYVIGNVIGAPTNWGWEAPNYHHGVSIYNGAHDNWIGWGGIPTGGNIILASGWSGVAIVGSNDNTVWANHIGTNGMDIHWGNAFYGITVSGSGNTILSNEITYNGTNGGLDNAQAGVLVDGAGSINNMITGNSIHDNDGPGIKLVNNGNNNLAAPVINDGRCDHVEGIACGNCIIEIYSDYEDEGRRYEGFVTASGSGSFTWNGVLFGPNATALAIGPGSARDTSPFSAPWFVGICRPTRIYLPLGMKE